jgi:hypothetical protein
VPGEVTGGDFPHEAAARSGMTCSEVVSVRLRCFSAIADTLPYRLPALVFCAPNNHQATKALAAHINEISHLVLAKPRTGKDRGRTGAKSVFLGISLAATMNFSCQL